VEELKYMGMLGDLSEGNIKGERRGAYLFDGGVGYFISEETFGELVGEVGKREFGELREGGSGEMRDLNGEVESSIGSESSKNRV
jgi:hypothetical protein